MISVPKPAVQPQRHSLINVASGQAVALAYLVAEIGEHFGYFEGEEILVHINERAAGRMNSTKKIETDLIGRRDVAVEKCNSKSRVFQDDFAPLTRWRAESGCLHDLSK
jgi:hypothetical protein